MKDFKIKDCYVCNFCRNICKASCDEDLKRLENGIVDDKNRDLVDFRKQRIECLGKWCDSPCEYQNIEAVPDIQIFVNTIKYLGRKCDELLETKY